VASIIGERSRPASATSHVENVVVRPDLAEHKISLRVGEYRVDDTGPHDSLVVLAGDGLVDLPYLRTLPLAPAAVGCLIV
jgi:hypothetical protein